MQARQASHKLQYIIQSAVNCGQCDVHFHARRGKFVAPSSVMAGIDQWLCKGVHQCAIDTSVHRLARRPVALRGKNRAGGEWHPCWVVLVLALRAVVHEVHIIALHHHDHHQTRISWPLTRLTGRQGERSHEHGARALAAYMTCMACQVPANRPGAVSSWPWPWLSSAPVHCELPLLQTPTYLLHTAPRLLGPV